MKTAAAYSYRTDEGVQHILAVEAQKFIHFVSVDCPITKRKVPKSEMRYMTPMTDKVGDIAKGFRKIGKRLGITKGARSFLRGI